MKSRSSLFLQVYYCVLLFLVLLGLGLSIQKFWFSGSLKASDAALVFEANLQLEEMGERNGVNRIEQLIKSDRARDALGVLQVFEKKSRELQSIQATQSFEGFEESLDQLKKAMGGFLDYPELQTIMLVLSDKLANFESFVTQNNWRTLMRMSKRTKAKIHPSKIKRYTSLSLSRLTQLSRTLDNELKAMKKIVKNSVLSLRKKGLILSQINKLRVEARMIKKYLASMKNFYPAFKKFKQHHTDWINEVKPIFAYQKIKQEKNNQYLFFTLLSLLTLVLFGLTGGYFLYKKNLSSLRREMEFFTLKSVEEGLIPLGGELEDHGSLDFRSKLIKYRDYFHKRMSFGVIFQEAVPFATALFDSNLNLIWGNSLLYEHFHLEEKKRETCLSWDAFQKYTNMGDSDPIMMALNQNLSGIYQIQIKKSEATDGLPYEMYISPIHYLDQTRIMIFFYPLHNLEKTLRDQTKSIIGPISRTLDLLRMGNRGEGSDKNLEKDFEIVGIGELFKKFKSYNDLLIQKEKALLDQIRDLENKLYDQHQLQENVKKIQKYLAKNINEVIDSFYHFKKTITQYTDLRSGLEDRFGQLNHYSKKLLQGEAELVEQSTKTGKVIEENMKNFENIKSVRDQLKACRSHVSDSCSTLKQSLDQTLLWIKKDPRQNDSGLEERLGHLKSDVKNIENFFSHFSSLLKELDVAFSKFGLVLEESEVPDLDHFKLEIEEIGKRFNELNQQVIHLISVGEKSDEVLVDNVRSLYDGFQASRKYGKELAHLINSQEGEPTSLGPRQES